MKIDAGYIDTCLKTESPDYAKAFLSILAYFFREVICSPVRLLRVAFRMSGNISSQIGVLQLLRFPVLAGFVCANPKFLFKHLPPKYLMQGMAPRTRTACFLHHYRKLNSLLPEPLLRRVLVDDVPVFELRQEEHLFQITMGRSRHVAHTRLVDHEGEMSLNLWVDHEQVFVLSFTIVPGWVVEMPDADVLMITRIQGGLGVFQKIALASKCMHGIPPEMLLVSALHGVAEAIGIPALAGVRAVCHLCYEEGDEAIFHKSYDELFTRIGAVKNQAGFFAAHFPLPEKDMALVKRGQKSRARVRRAFKAHVVSQIFSYLGGRPPAIASMEYGEANNPPEFDLASLDAEEPELATSASFRS